MSPIRQDTQLVDPAGEPAEVLDVMWAQFRLARTRADSRVTT